MSYFRLAATAALLLASTTVAAACGASAADSASDPRYSQPLQRVLQRWRAEYEAVGVAMAVGFADGSVWSGANGLADRAARIPLAPGDSFRIGSITKTFTALVVLQLAEEGLLGLDDTIAEYVDGVPNGERMTLRQLLNHTAGAYNHTEHPAFEDLLEASDRAWTPEEVVALAAREGPGFEPGTDWSYSNTGYILLGMAVEAATGRPFHAELSRRLLDPLALGDTVYVSGPDTPEDMAHGYVDLDGDRETEDVESASRSAIVVSAGADGAMVSNVTDLVRFARALMGDEIVSEDLWRQMHSTGEPNREYGLGVQYLTPVFWQLPAEASPGPIWGHSGGFPGFESLLVYLPERDVAVAVVVNEEGGPVWRLLDLVGSALGVVLKEEPLTSAFALPSARLYTRERRVETQGLGGESSTRRGCAICSRD